MTAKDRNTLRDQYTGRVLARIGPANRASATEFCLLERNRGNSVATVANKALAARL
ncbi:MAG: hypothetical protein ACYDBQ_02930 [Thermoplasmatota archaeon]